MGNIGQFKPGQKAWNKGLKHTLEAIKKMSLSHTQPSDETRERMRQAKLGKKLPKETRQKMSEAHKGYKRTEDHQRKLNEANSGPNHGNWKGGITPAQKVIRMSKEYRLWREAVFARDNYTCMECGKHGGRLHPHHIKPFALYPDLRFDVNNGQTLCVPCHKKTPTYGGNFRNNYERA